MAGKQIGGAAWVNDLHSGLNPTRVGEIALPRSPAEIAQAVARARRQGQAVAIAGGRHAMGGQQFARDALLLDMRGLDRVLGFDRERGLIEVEAGIQWPALFAWLRRAQQQEGRP